MWNLVLYSLAVFFGFILFRLYDEKNDSMVEAESLESLQSVWKSWSLLLSNFNDDVLCVTKERRFPSLHLLKQAFRVAEIDNIRLIIGVDFSSSNEWQGRKTFDGQCLHRVVSGTGTLPIDGGSFASLNPYQSALVMLSKIFGEFVPTKAGGGEGFWAFGFGDATTRSEKVFPFRIDGEPLRDFHELFAKYFELASVINLKGPTSFEPLFNMAINITRFGKYWKLDGEQRISDTRHTAVVVLTDGMTNDAQHVTDIMIKCSSYPMSIIMIGLGDGPWSFVESIEKHLKRRAAFDIFQFVDFNRWMGKSRETDEEFALEVLMKFPDQFTIMKRLNYL